MSTQKDQTVALGRIASALEANTATRARDTSREPRGERLPIIARFILFAGTSKAGDARSRAVRRSFPIRGYVGPNGGGKSLAMVHDVLPSLDAGRTVLSTVALLGADGKPHPAYVPFTDFGQLLEAEHCDVLMDEIVGIANSRDGNKLPSPVQNLLVQLRRRDITLSWSAPNWARADKIIREVTQAVTECRGYYPGRSGGAVSESGVRLWAPRRVFKFRTFDTAEFEEWTAGKREKMRPLAAQWFKGPGSRAFASYDTLDSVSMVSGGSDDTCPYCDKKKRADYCKGHTAAEIAELPVARAVHPLREITGGARRAGVVELVEPPSDGAPDHRVHEPQAERGEPGDDHEPDEHEHDARPGEGGEVAIEVHPPSLPGAALDGQPAFWGSALPGKHAATH